MNSSIVKVYSKTEEYPVFGNGVVLDNNTILTPLHVVADMEQIVVKYNEKEFICKIACKNDVIAIVKVDGELLEEKDEDIQAFKFVDNELLDENTEWQVNGYITNKQIDHIMTGKGVCANTTISHTCDFSLKDIFTGGTGNYQGLSGAPVVCRNRVIGIIQMQRTNYNGTLGVTFSSVNMFKDLLPSYSIGNCAFIDELEQSCVSNMIEAVNINKSSKKYIPDIYVEEGEYKEDLRCFADPILFMNKIIEELKNLDLTIINDFYVSQGEDPIDFLTLPDNTNNADIQELIRVLEDKLNKIISNLNDVEKNERKRENSTEEHSKLLSIFNTSLQFDLDDILKRIRFFKYQFVMLTRNAGQGKTNFLCDFAENFLIKKRISSFFFNAADFCEAPISVIKSKLTIGGKYEYSYVKEVLYAEWERTSKLIIVLIDGLNENMALSSFGDHIKNFLTELLQVPFIKVVMTTRNELYDENFGMLNQESLGEKFYRLDMWFRDDKFRHRIFEGYLKFFDITILHETLLPSTYDSLSNDTLMLRFFCEVNQGKKQIYMYDIYKYQLFKEYCIKKQKEIAALKKEDIALFEHLINDICEYMLNHKIFSGISKREFSVENIKTIRHLIETDVIFKEEKKKRIGLMDNQFDEVLSFTFDEYRDYCLTNYVLTRSDAQTYFPYIWKLMIEENWTIRTGVEKYVFFLSRTDAPEVLPIITHENDYERIYWDNIWELDEQYISAEDISRWEEQYDIGGPYRRVLTRYLLARRDRKYFKKVNIDLLFSIFDRLSHNVGKYDNTIRLLFPIRKTDRFNLKVEEKDAVFYSNEMVKFLEEILLQNQVNDLNKDYLRLSIYIYELLHVEICEIWIKAYKKVPGIVKQIMNVYVNQKDISEFIRQTVLEILEGINKVCSDRYLIQAINEIRKINSLNLISEELLSLWKES